MSIFVYTRSNYNALKTKLMSDFEMRSGHASEAIAALVGFKSHSAFRSICGTGDGSTVLTANFDAFEKRSVDLGYDLESAEWLRESYSNFDFPVPAWRLVKKRDLGLRDAWFYDCERRGVPFIIISKATKYFTVEWDHITMDSDYDRIAKNAFGGQLHRVLFRNYQRITAGLEPKSYFEGGALVGEVKGLSEASARQIANMLATYLYPENARSLSNEAA